MHRVTQLLVFPSCSEGERNAVGMLAEGLRTLLADKPAKAAYSLGALIKMLDAISDVPVDRDTLVAALQVLADEDAPVLHFNGRDKITITGHGMTANY